jgi:hypothetical protein
MKRRLELAGLREPEPEMRRSGGRPEPERPE